MNISNFRVGVTSPQKRNISQGRAACPELPELRELTLRVLGLGDDSITSLGSESLNVWGVHSFDAVSVQALLRGALSVEGTFLRILYSYVCVLNDYLLTV